MRRKKEHNKLIKRCNKTPGYEHLPKEYSDYRSLYIAAEDTFITTLAEAIDGVVVPINLSVRRRNGHWPERKRISDLVFELLITGRVGLCAIYDMEYFWGYLPHLSREPEEVQRAWKRYDAILFVQVCSQVSPPRYIARGYDLEVKLTHRRP